MQYLRSTWHPVPACGAHCAFQAALHGGTLLLGISYHSCLMVFSGVEQVFPKLLGNLVPEAMWNTDNLMPNVVLCPSQLWTHVATWGCVSCIYMKALIAHLLEDQWQASVRLPGVWHESLFLRVVPGLAAWTSFRSFWNEASGFPSQI